MLSRSGASGIITGMPYPIRRISELNNPVLKRSARKLVKKPRQTLEDSHSVGLPQRHHHNPVVGFVQVGDRMIEITICRQEDRLLILS